MKAFSLLLLVTLLAFAHSPSRSVAQEDAKESPQEIANHCSSFEYMASISCFMSAEKDVIGHPNQTFFDQALATVLSYIGEEREARRINDRSSHHQSNPQAFDPAHFTAHSAEEEILERIKNRQLLLINEAHHVPETRLLTLRLLKPLYEQGFRYLAAETFSDSVYDTFRSGHPTIATGYYTAEPVYSLIVREALKIGYNLVPYESVPNCDPFHELPDKCQNLREEGQAKNLVERIFKADPHAKVLVHAGYGHIDKKGISGDYNWIPMARYLWTMTGIEPFSVDQTFFYERGDARLDSSVYKKAVSHFDFSKPSILVNRKTGKPYISTNHQEHYDLQIFLPPLRSINGRPSWRAQLPNSQRIETSGWQCSDGQRCLLQAAYANQPRDVIAADRAVVVQGSADLYLAPGRYELLLFDSQDAVIEKRQMIVK